jgi:hypothetical protein
MKMLKRTAKCQWLTPVVLATQKAEIRIAVRSQPWKIVHEALSQKPLHKKIGLVG